MTTLTTVDEYQDILDSRDIIAEIEDLENVDPRDDEENEELAKLKALANEANGSPDWEHGEALIRYSHFKEYAQELAEDCCDMPTDAQWPMRCIDWDQAARELQMDYFSVEFGDITYWIRS